MNTYQIIFSNIYNRNGGFMQIEDSIWEGVTWEYIYSKLPFVYKTREEAEEAMAMLNSLSTKDQTNQILNNKTKK